MSNKSKILFILYTVFVVIITVFVILSYLKSTSFNPIPSGSGETATAGISYIAPANWHVTKQAGDYRPDGSWSWQIKESIVIESPDRSKNIFNCGINCDNTSPSGKFEIDTYDTHQIQDVQKWYIARLQNHQAADGPNTTYSKVTLDNQPAYCARYNIELYDESCFVLWHDTVYGFSLISSNYVDFATEKLIRSSITFH